MEGVLVSAQQARIADHRHRRKSTATASLRFPGRKTPAGPLRAAHPSRRLRPGHAAIADFAVGNRTTIELKLRKTKDLAAQLTSTEWLMSFPGTAEQKRPLIECMSCHTLERMVRSKFDADAFMPVLKRMTELRQQHHTGARAEAGRRGRISARIVPARWREYLATVNLSQGESWSYPLQTLPRPTGAATRAMITEYDLPRRTIAPHDVRTDQNGFIWYSNFVEHNLGRLDPRPARSRNIAYPELKPGFPGRRARDRAGRRRQLVAGHDVPGRARQVRR